MAKGGCKAFAALVAASPDALSTFQSAADGGVTAFCPTDDAMRAFMPTYKNLTADGKASLLLFHAVPVYYSLRSLKSNNGVMNTLATDGSAKNFNFTVQNEGDKVTIKTDASDGVARIKDTVYDKDPIAIYAVDTVLEPVELFEPAESPAPAPAPVADAPKASKSKKASHRHVADAPGRLATTRRPPTRGRAPRRTTPPPAPRACGGSPPCPSPSPWPPPWLSGAHISRWICRRGWRRRAECRWAVSVRVLVACACETCVFFSWMETA